MKIRDLRLALQKIDPMDDDKEVVIWMPGSVIDLNCIIFPCKARLCDPGTFAIEGNLKPGSALCVD